MKSFKNLIEDQDYILSENEKFSERGNTISYIKRNELEEYYNAFVGGDGYEFEKLTEMEMTEKMWKVIEKYIMWNDYQIDGKKIDLYSDPYYERVRFIGGSDVPINGHYE